MAGLHTLRKALTSQATRRTAPTGLVTAREALAASGGGGVSGDWVMDTALPGLPAPSSTDLADHRGLKYQVDANLTINGLRVYSPISGVATLYLWNNADVEHERHAVEVVENGWATVVLGTPLSLVTGEEFTVSMYKDSVDANSVGGSYYDTDRVNVAGVTAEDPVSILGLVFGGTATAYPGSFNGTATGLYLTDISVTLN